MSDLQKRLDEAKAEVDRLEREKRQATCVELGAHDWRSYGGAIAGCDDECNCSVPVYKCARCGDYDYGENAEAAEIMRACAAGDER